MQELKARQIKVDAIIDRLGGTNAVAQMVGVVPAAVSNWRKRGKFPAHTYVQIGKALEITPPAYLWGMHKLVRKC
jgi:DNA-binding transcriptional regulator YdaS (Cro superfamily)